MKRYLNLNDNSYDNYCDDIDSSFMIEIPDDDKPYGLVNGKVVDISITDEYKVKINEQKKVYLQTQINELDLKSIRAMREGGIKDTTTGQTWIEYYTIQISELREKISNL